MHQANFFCLVVLSLLMNIVVTDLLLIHRKSLNFCGKSVQSYQSCWKAVGSWSYRYLRGEELFLLIRMGRDMEKVICSCTFSTKACMPLGQNEGGGGEGFLYIVFGFRRGDLNRTKSQVIKDNSSVWIGSECSLTRLQSHLNPLYSYPFFSFSKVQS